jgi:uncharacterized protein (UPF0333 family)
MMTLKKCRGQGVVEYAGALVIAAIFVATAIAVGPPTMNSIYSQIYSSTEAMFKEKAAAIK